MNSNRQITAISSNRFKSLCLQSSLVLSGGDVLKMRMFMQTKQSSLPFKLKMSL